MIVRESQHSKRAHRESSRMCSRFNTSMSSGNCKHSAYISITWLLSHISTSMHRTKGMLRMSKVRPRHCYGDETLISGFCRCPFVSGRKTNKERKHNDENQSNWMKKRQNRSPHQCKKDFSLCTSQALYWYPVISDWNRNLGRQNWQSVWSMRSGKMTTIIVLTAKMKEEEKAVTVI